MSSRYDLSENHAAILRTSTWPCVRTRRTASIEPKGKGRRQWFERGEVAALMKRLVKAPMAQADIVRALAQSKGYDRRLAGKDAKRFAAAAYMGVLNAIKAGHARQLGDGRVRMG